MRNLIFRYGQVHRKALQNFQVFIELDPPFPVLLNPEMLIDDLFNRLFAYGNRTFDRSVLVVEKCPGRECQNQNEAGNGVEDRFFLTRLEGGVQNDTQTFLCHFFRPFFNQFLLKRFQHIVLTPFKFIQFLQQIQHRLRAVSRIFCHHFPDQFDDPGFDVRSKLFNGNRHALENFCNDIKFIFSGERRFPGQHLIKSRSETVNICPGIHIPCAAALFRRGICRCADHGPFHGQTQGVAGVIDIFGDPHIRQLDLTVFLDHDICRLDVPVNDPVFRSVSKTFGGFNDDMDRLFFCDRSLLENVADGLTFNVFHHDVGKTGFRFQFHIHHRNDIGMLDLGGKFRFPDETLPEFRILFRSAGVQNFHGTQRIQLGVPDQIHRTHAA